MKTTTKPPRGRPRVDITKEQWKVIERMAQDMCTAEEIADYLGIARRTLYAEHIKERFERLMRMKQAATKWKIRQRQVRAAIKGHPVSSIWWGKQHLGQRDKHEHTGAEGGPLEVITGVNERLNSELDKLDRLKAQTQAESSGT